ncbi:hypothetical protein J4430_02670 [Candidatus Woesearchaeota archaeon]|nr:hypothetical protein [Candidatus Woesearchaeota archaeon]
MQKRGQLYIIAALIFSAVLYTLATQANTYRQEDFAEGFDDLSTNYATESERLVNSLLYSNQDVLSGFTNFTLLFTGYTKSKNPSFGLIYIFEFNETIQVGNFLDRPIIIDTGDAQSYDFHNLEGCFDRVSAVVKFAGLSFSSDVAAGDIQECILTFPTKDQIWIGVDDAWYPFSVVRGKPTLMIVTRQEAQEQRKVFIGGEGFVRNNRDRPGLRSHCEQLSLTSCELAGNRRLCCVRDGDCVPQYNCMEEG